jgi:general secretion pathway protein E
MSDRTEPITSATIERVLERRGLLSPPAIERVRRLEAESGERIDHIGAKLGLVSERDLAALYSELLGSAVVNPAEFPLDAIADGRLQRAFLKQAKIIPLAESETELVVAMADPFNENSVKALEFALGKPVRRRVAVPADLDAAFARLYGDAPPTGDAIYEAIGERQDDDREADLERLRDLASEAPVIRLVNSLIVAAVEMGASDIHLEAGKAGCVSVIASTDCCAKSSRRRDG